MLSAEQRDKQRDSEETGQQVCNFPKLEPATLLWPLRLILRGSDGVTFTFYHVLSCSYVRDLEVEMLEKLKEL